MGILIVVCSVKLPKTFLAVNLSDAFSFQEKQNSESQETTQNGTESQEAEAEPQNGTDSDGLEMKRPGRGGAPSSTEPPVPKPNQPETETLDPAKEVEAAEHL